MNTAINYFYMFLESASYMILAAMGMSIIYGMMRMTNLATGQLIMVGAYTTSVLYNWLGVPFPIAIIGAMIVNAALGWLIETLIIRRLYNRRKDAIVATWGISIFLQQAIYMIFGPTMSSIPVPFGSIEIGNNAYSVYRILLIGIALLMVFALYLLFNFTRFGLHARATMQNAEIANTMGVNSKMMNVVTFSLGAALAGLTGGLYAPTVAIQPALGSNFMTQSFVTVLVGGVNPLTGTILAGSALGLINGVLSLKFTTFYGRIGILLAGILFIRFLPDGFSGLVKSGGRGKRFGKGVMKNEQS